MATSPNATPTPITPPRVPLIDARTGLIDRAWYMFFLSLFQSAQISNDSQLESNAESLIASYDAALRALAQATESQPPQPDCCNSIDAVRQEVQTNPTTGVAELAQEVDAVRQEVQTEPATGVTELAQEVSDLRQEVKTLPQPQLGTFAALQQANLPWTTFNTTPENVPTDIGTTSWDGGATLGIQMTASVLQRVGESEYVYVKASSAITKGQLCYHTGAVGSSGVITAAPTPLALADPNQIVGVAAETIALNGFGLIQISGVLRGFNTTGSSVGEVWADGDALYYNPAFVGSMTKVKPLAPNQKSYIGEVINAGSGGSGSMHVRIVPGSVLGGTDSNVEIISVAANDLLVYDSTDQRWENKQPTDIFNIAGLLANSVLYLNASKIVTTSTSLTFDGTGLGIGTSSPASKLHVSNTAAATRITITDDVANGRSGYIESNFSDALVIGTTSGVRGIRFSPDNTARMYLDTVGNLGIGTSSPSYKLDISAPNDSTARVRLATTTGYNIFWSQNTSGGTWVGTEGSAGGSLMSGTPAWASVITSTAAAPICFGTNTAERMRLTATGNQIFFQPAESAQNTSVTLTVANLQTRVITSNAVVTLTLPTGTDLEGYTASMATDTAFECTFIATTANAITIAANGNTTVGNLTVSGNTSGTFRFRRTALNTFTVYRVA